MLGSIVTEESTVPEQTVEKQEWALLWVHDHGDLVAFATELIADGWKIMTVGETTTVLREAGLTVLDLAYYVEQTGFGHEFESQALSLAGCRGLATLEAMGHIAIGLVYVDLPFHPSEPESSTSPPDVSFNTDVVGRLSLILSATQLGRIVVCHARDLPKLRKWFSEKRKNEVTFLALAHGGALDTVARYCQRVAIYTRRLLMYGINPTGG